jgi:DNA-binding transcriptional MocR family regulator
MSAVHLLLPELDRAAPSPLAAQIAGFYARAIQDGRMRVGERLPPIRAVASACDVTRSTVQEAYRQLADEGLVEGTVGRGTGAWRQDGGGRAAAVGGR